jgi:hypothetical protein
MLLNSTSTLDELEGVVLAFYMVEFANSSFTTNGLGSSIIQFS